MSRSRKGILLLLLCWAATARLQAQVEHTPVTHPVYDFLLRAEAAGYLDRISLASLPLQRKEVVGSLINIRRHERELSESEKETLVRFEREFLLRDRSDAVLFTSPSDSSFFWPIKVFSNDEKLLYFYRDSSTMVHVYPLGMLGIVSRSAPDSTGRAYLGQGGLRLFGTIKNKLGFYLQATNGAVFTGDRRLAMEAIPKLRQSAKFARLNSDIDFSESHIRYEDDWFYATIGRETRQIGSGYFYRAFTSSAAPPYDALSLGAKFSSFEYRYTHAQLVSLAESENEFGTDALIPPKYMASHRFAFRQPWGEIGLWENVIYSRRSIDLGYLNPLSFFKSVEHSLHDRDNTALGLDASVRPVGGLQLRGSFFLDDLIIGEIGNDFWGNKSAWNIGALFTSLPNIDLFAEYARVNPFTYSHFSVHNSMTNDGVMIAGDLLPNSDRSALQMRWWWGNRYPVALSLSYTRHGMNSYAQDSTGAPVLERNVGSDPLQTLRIGIDPERVPFLSGDLKNILALSLSAGYEVLRGLHFQLYYQLQNDGLGSIHTTAVSFRYEDF